MLLTKIEKIKYKKNNKIDDEYITMMVYRALDFKRGLLTLI